MYRANNAVTKLATVMIGSALVLTGCAGGADAPHAVTGGVELIDRSSRPLLAADLLSANGTYGDGCTTRTGAWSVAIDSGATLDNAALSVVQGNTACVLTLTELHTASGAIAANPSFAMTGSYQTTASSFGSAPIEFYANARLSSTSFASNFTVQLVFSDDPNAASASRNASFAVADTSASASSIESPDYSIALTGITLQTDEGDVVQSASGTAALTAGDIAGQTFVVATGSGFASFDDMDTAYLAGTPAAIPMSNAIPVSAFGLGGTDLTSNQVRSLIVANTVDGVRAYQTFTITFGPAAR
jgi:hypothetical protein